MAWRGYSFRMRRLALALLLAMQAAAWPAAPSHAQTDAVADLLQNLQTALQSGTIDSFAAESAPALPAGQRLWLATIAPPGRVAAVTIRERARSAADVAAEIFVSYGTRGFVASWRLEIETSRMSGRARLRSISEISRFDRLIRLDLDEQRQFIVEDFVASGPDFTVRVPFGVVFVADVTDRTTAFIIRGRAEVRFTPPDPAEQGQVRIFHRSPALTVETDELFIRAHPGDVDRRVTWSRLEQMPVAGAAVTRARTTFGARSARSYHFDLGDLAADSWSLEPSPGSLLVDFRTSRHGWLTYALTPEDTENVSLIDRDRRRQISLYTSSDRLANGFKPETDDASYEVRHTALDLSFDPDRRWLSGRASITLAMRRDVASFTLKLADSLAVSSISSPELGQLLPLRTTGYDSLIVALPTSLPAGGVITLDVQYHGRLNPEDLSQDGLRVDGEAQDAGIPDVPISLEPRYLYSNRSWWYPQSAVARHATASIRLTVPAEYEALATGELVSNRTSEAPLLDRGARGGVRTVEYRTDRPVRYLASLISRLQSIGSAAARVPAVATADGTGFPTIDAQRVLIDVLVAPGQSRRVRATPERVASIVEFYSNMIGEAPYPALRIAALESTTPGGHSPAFFAMINQPHPLTRLSWANDPVAFAEAPDFFLAHEIAHQWWGQAVGGHSYHDQWISEGFAHYFAWMYVASSRDRRADHGAHARHGHRPRRRGSDSSGVAARPSARRRSYLSQRRLQQVGGCSAYAPSPGRRRRILRGLAAALFVGAFSIDRRRRSAAGVRVDGLDIARTFFQTLGEGGRCAGIATLLVHDVGRRHDR